jgi:hypothetical protein
MGVCGWYLWDVGDTECKSYDACCTQGTVRHVIFILVHIRVVQQCWVGMFGWCAQVFLWFTTVLHIALAGHAKVARLTVDVCSLVHMLLGHAYAHTRTA